MQCNPAPKVPTIYLYLDPGAAPVRPDFPSIVLIQAAAARMFQRSSVLSGSLKAKRRCLILDGEHLIVIILIGDGASIFSNLFAQFCPKTLLDRRGSSYSAGAHAQLQYFSLSLSLSFSFAQTQHRRHSIRFSSSPKAFRRNQWVWGAGMGFASCVFWRDPGRGLSTMPFGALALVALRNRASGLPPKSTIDRLLAALLVSSSSTCVLAFDPYCVVS